MLTACQEATPVLFAINVFEVETTTAINDFVKLIGDSARHLRHIRVDRGGYKLTTVREALKALTIAKNLRTLEFFHHSEFCEPHHWTSEEMAKDCKTLLKSLQKSYIELNISANVLDVVKIYGGRHDQNMKMQNEVRAVVAKYLGIDQE